MSKDRKLGLLSIWGMDDLKSNHFQILVCAKGSAKNSLSTDICNNDIEGVAQNAFLCSSLLYPKSWWSSAIIYSNSCFFYEHQRCRQRMFVVFVEDGTHSSTFASKERDITSFRCVDSIKTFFESKFNTKSFLSLCVKREFHIRDTNLRSWFHHLDDVQQHTIRRNNLDSFSSEWVSFVFCESWYLSAPIKESAAFSREWSSLFVYSQRENETNSDSMVIN